jgi:dsRNA-specific ribonuclease
VNPNVNPKGGPYTGGPYTGGPYTGGPYTGGPYTGGPYTGGPYPGPYTGGPYTGGTYRGGPPPVRPEVSRSSFPLEFPSRGIVKPPYYVSPPDKVRFKGVEEEKSKEAESIYIGPRNDEFKELIKALLVRGRLFPKYMDILLNEDSMKEYSKAFTAESADKDNNSEVYEQLGDVTANKFIIWYMYKRFPQLMCTEGVKFVARLRINYGAKQSFYNIAQCLGFWKFISASEEDRKRKMKPLLEDSLEAFIGVTEYLLDTNFRQGVGNAIVYDILASIFDELPISLSYESLYDAKTRLKELVDFYGDKLGSIEYREEKNDMIVTSRVYRVIGPQSYLIGEGMASLKADAQQRAAENALKKLNENGYVKPIPEVYSKFCKK